MAETEHAESHAHGPVKPQDKIPVTIITGFLGAGKTTLMSFILNNKSHGYRIAVINNEFASNASVGSMGEMGKETLTSAAVAAEIYETASGCLCCGGGNDFKRILHQLLHHREKFDYVLVETTGMADPSFSNVFLMDPYLADNFVLDGIVTLVDAAHCLRNIEMGPTTKKNGITVLNETIEQLAIADRIILNKVDLSTEKELSQLEKRIRGINSMAPMIRTEYSRVPNLADFLQINAFDVEQVLKKDAGFMSMRRRSHDDAVSDLCFEGEGAIDEVEFRKWAQAILTERKEQVLRFKAQVHVKGSKERYIYQGVHAMLDGSARHPWNEEEAPQHKLIFIGRDLGEGKDILDSFNAKFGSSQEEGQGGTKQQSGAVLRRSYGNGESGPPETLYELLVRSLIPIFLLFLLYRYV